MRAELKYKYATLPEFQIFVGRRYFSIPSSAGGIAVILSEQTASCRGR